MQDADGAFHTRGSVDFDGRLAAHAMTEGEAVLYADLAELDGLGWKAAEVNWSEVFFGYASGTRKCAKDAGIDAADASQAHHASDSGSAPDANLNDSGTCDSVRVSADVKMVTVPGNVLMIFDRSGSMQTDWNGKPRWQAAGGAMVSALTPVQDQLTVGAVFFPDDDAMLSCGVSSITSATQLDFQAGAQAVTKMQTGRSGGAPMYQPGLGQTPTLEALKVADAALASAALTGSTSVIVVTDGDPNCNWDQTMAVSLVTSWAGHGIKTYVLGVPGVGGTGEATLNEVAKAGGTTQYIAASDAASLQTVMHQIVAQTVSVKLDTCAIVLGAAVATPSELHMVITDATIDYEVPHKWSGDATASWNLAGDGQTVNIVGNLCTKLEAGTYEALRFEQGCVSLPELAKP